MEIIARCLPLAVAAEFRSHVRHFLGRELTDTVAVPVRRVKVHFPTFDDLWKSGGIYELELRLWGEDTGSPVCFEEPTSAMQPIATDLLDIVERGFDRYRPKFYGPVSWSVRKLFTAVPEDPRQNANTHVRTLRGRSPTLAVCVAFRALAERKTVDPGYLMSAAFQFDETNPAIWDRAWREENPHLFAVNGEKQKADAACQYGHLTRFLIAVGSAFEGNRPEYKTEKGRTILLGRPATLDEAYSDATGLMAGLKEYLAFTSGLLSAVTPKYFDDRKLSGPFGLYIEPDVFKDDVQVQADPKSDADQRSNRSGKLKAKLQFGAETETEELIRYYTERVTTTRVKWRVEWPKMQHAVVIGYPGDGKSVLARKLVTDLSGQSQTKLEKGECAANELPLPIFIRLEEIGKAGTLEAAMRRQLPEGTPEVVKDHLDSALFTELAWVVLDGWDEAADEGKVVTQLARLAKARCRVILTSRPSRYRRSELPFLKLAEYRLAPFNDDQRQEFLNRWFAAAPDPARQQVVERLTRGNPSVAEMTRNALLLSLICAVSEKKDLDPVSTRRPQIYRAIVEQLSGAVWKDAPICRSDPASHTRVLCHVAWELFRREPAAWAFHAANQWVPAIDQAIGKKYSFTVDLFHKELRDSGLVVETGNGTEAFLHRTFLEYLAAEYVATLPDPVVEIEQFLWQPDRKTRNLKWTPAAAEFLTLLAGCLKDPTPLLKRIQREHAKRPDALYVMARLGSRCLVDVDSSQFDVALVKPLLDGAYEAYWSLGETEQLAHSFAHPAGGGRPAAQWGWLTRPDVTKLLKLIQNIGSAANTPAVLNRIIRSFRDQSEYVRSLAVEALGTLGTTPEVVSALVDRVLRDEDHGVRLRASTALDSLGGLGTAAKPEVISALVDSALHDEKEDVRSNSIEALGSLGAGATKEVIDALMDRALHDASERVCRSAIRALGSLGTAATKEVVDLLVDCAVRGNELLRRMAATDAVGSLGMAAVPEVVDALVDRLLHNDNGHIRENAAEVLGWLGTVAARSEVISALVHHALRDDDNRVRREAACALGSMGTAASTPEVVAALVDRALRDKDCWVCASASEALRSLGKATATPELIGALVERTLHHEYGSIRLIAARVLGSLGITATQEVVAALVDRAFRDEEKDVRVSAVKALGTLGTPAATPQVLCALADRVLNPETRDWNTRITPDDFCTERTFDALCSAVTPEVVGVLVDRALRDDKEDVRLSAVKALGTVGTATATPLVVGALVDRAIRDENWLARDIAVESLGSLGKKATLEVVAALVGRALRDEKGDVRRSAVRALGSCGAVAAAKPEMIGALVDRALHDEDHGVRLNAIEALGLLGAAAAKPEVISALVGCALHDEKEDVRRNAVEALGSLGAAATPEVISVLVDRTLHDEDHGVRGTAAEALGTLGTVAATPEVINALKHALRDNYDRAVRALSQFLNYPWFINRTVPRHNLGVSLCLLLVVLIFLSSAGSKSLGENLPLQVGVMLAVFGGLRVALLLSCKDFSFLGPVLWVLSLLSLVVVSANMGLVFAGAILALACGFITSRAQKTFHLRGADTNMSAYMLGGVWGTIGVRATIIIYNFVTDPNLSAALELLALAVLFAYSLRIFWNVNSVEQN